MPRINELAKHEGCKDALVNAGIIPILLSVMQGHAGNPHVQALGLKCLATLCANNSAIQTGAAFCFWGHAIRL